MLHRVDSSSPTVATPQGVTSLLSLALVAFVFALEAAPAQAQEWSLYLAWDDRFSIDFPSEPTIHETTHVTGYGITLPARVYTAEDDFGTYSATAVNWREAEELYQESFEACQVATGDLRGGDNPGICYNQARRDIRGATLHAAFGFLERGSEVTYFGPAIMEGVVRTFHHQFDLTFQRIASALAGHYLSVYQSIAVQLLSQIFRCRTYP